jgi:tetratricopeptide (TPR) repeat protein
MNALIGGAFIAAFLIRAPRFADRIDKLMLVGLVLFTLACVFSLFPRQSFDAAIAGMAYVAAFFLMRGELDFPQARRLLIAAMATLSFALTFFFASLWLPEAFAWWSSTGDLPPLALRYPSLWWGHRYDVGLMLLILLPSWWIGRQSPVRFAFGTVTGSLTLLLVLLSGSRTLWLAAAVAGIFAGAPFAVAYLRTNRAKARSAVIASLAAGAALIASGLGAVIVDRVLASETIAARGEMWLILAKGAMDHPLGGFGLGAFAWILQATAYFDTNSWAPRHPDSSIFQLLAEGGGLGLAAAIAWIVAIGPTIWRSSIVAARLGVGVFAVACLATSATDFGFLLIPTLAWIAYAAPRPTRSTDGPTDSPRPIVRSALIAAVVVVVLAFMSTTFAIYAYGVATVAGSRRSLADRRDWLNRAIALDPGMALYWRQRGALELQKGDIEAARSDLERAVRINAFDDLAWRTKAIAELADGDDAAARASVEVAVDRQRSDPTNLLLLSWMAQRSGDNTVALDALEEVVQGWPAVTGAPGWRAMLPSGVSMTEVIEEAARRWSAGEPSPQPPLDQILWLEALGALDQRVPGQPSNQLGPELTSATISVLTCATDAAEALDRVPEAERRSPTFWALAVREAGNQSPTEALRLHDTISSAPLEPRSRVEALNPLNENGSRGFSADKWGYRRRAVIWPDAGILLPSPDWGYLTWIRDPTAAIAESGLDRQLADCR